MPQAAVPTDEELLQRAQEGDALAFRALVERYEEAVAATVVGMMGPGPDADDVGQETFIRFYKSMHRFRGESALKTYLTRIAINQALKALKKRQRWNKRFFRQDDEATTLEIPDLTAGEEMGTRERRELIASALQVLTPEHRSVVVLRMLEGYDTNETAAMLDVPPGTVMSRLSRALEKLETVLKPLVG